MCTTICGTLSPEALQPPVAMLHALCSSPHQQPDVDYYAESVAQMPQKQRWTYCHWCGRRCSPKEAATTPCGVPVHYPCLEVHIARCRDCRRIVDKDELTKTKAVNWHSQLPSGMSRAAPDICRKIRSAWAGSSVNSKLEYQLHVRGDAGGKASGKASNKTTSEIEGPAVKAERGRKGAATAQPSAHS